MQGYEGSDVFTVSTKGTKALTETHAEAGPFIMGLGLVICAATLYLLLACGPGCGSDECRVWRALGREQSLQRNVERPRPR